MNIVIAPHMPILANGFAGDAELESLSLLSLPNNIVIVVPEKWDDFLANCAGITSDYELFSLLLELPVKEVSTVKKAKYIKLNPDILHSCEIETKVIAKQQLFALSQYKDARRIYAGTNFPAHIFEISSDRNSVMAINFKPGGDITLQTLIRSFEPVLNQLKHFHEGRFDGTREVSPFSAYDKNNEQYAKLLLKQAYEEHNGDVDDRTYLYTYDSKNKTFVEFRPSRENTYHGQDIDIDYAKSKAPDIVRLYHK